MILVTSFSENMIFLMPLDFLLYILITTWLGIKTSNLFLVKQMKPSSIPGDLKLNSSQAELFQGWHRNGQCPEGTIPIIRRSQEDEYLRAIHLKTRRAQLNHSFADYNRNHEVSFYQKTDILNIIHVNLFHFIIFFFWHIYLYEWYSN